MATGAEQQGGPPAVSQHPLRELFAIAAPTVTTMASYTVMVFTDSWVVSHIGPEPIYNGAQGNGGLAAWIPMSFAAGTLQIINTYVSQHFGAGTPRQGPAYVWNGLWVALAYWLAVLLPLSFALPWAFGGGLASIVPTLKGIDPAQAGMSATYGQILLRGAILTMWTRSLSQFFYGMHRARVVMVAGIVANICNLLFNCVLIFGNGPRAQGLGPLGDAAHAIASALNIPPQGIAGSAYGTVLATLIELAIPLGAFLSPSLHANYGTRSGWRLSGPHVRDILRLGWPAGLMFGNEMICWGFFMIGLVSSFGPQHADAAWIAHRYMQLSFMPAVGLSVACTALVGKYMGMGRPDVAQQRTWLAVKLAAFYMGCCALLFVLAPGGLMAPFIPADAPGESRAVLLHLGRNFMAAMATFQLFDAGAMVLSGALRGAGDTTVPGVATVVLSWSIIVGGGFAMIRWAPRLESLGPWIAASAYIIVLCLFLVARFVSGHWKSIRLVGTSLAPTAEAAEGATTDGI